MWRIAACGAAGAREASLSLGDHPAEDRQLDHKAIRIKELCTRYFADPQAGLILGKGGRPKKPSTITTDAGRIEHHIVPLVGARQVKDLGFTELIIAAPGAQGASPSPGSPAVRNASHIFPRYDGAKHHIL